MRALGYGPPMSMDAYLAPSEYIDFHHPSVLAKAQELASGADSEHVLVDRCFRFVRDEIRHSWDHRCNPVTRRASEVLFHGTGYCYAKSHLLAALLRANGVPTGLCYQRLAVGDSGPPYCLHGLNAVWLAQHGWYRLDARGNKPGIAAEFHPPVERLAFQPRDAEERDFAAILAEPLDVVMRALSAYDDVAEVIDHLPDATDVD